MTPLLQGCLCKPAVRVQEFTMSRACHKSNITNMISQKPKKKENKENTDIFTRSVNRYLQSTLFSVYLSIICLSGKISIQHSSPRFCVQNLGSKMDVPFCLILRFELVTTARMLILLVCVSKADNIFSYFQVRMCHGDVISQVNRPISGKYVQHLDESTFH